MSEIEGYIVIHTQDADTRERLVKAFERGTTLELGESTYRVWEVVADDALDLHFYTNEHANTAELSRYILETFAPEILISTFEGRGYLGNEKVSYRRAFEELARESPRADFHFRIEHGDDAGALELLEGGAVSLEDRFAGVPFYEKAFFGDHRALMEYALEAGYHDHSCQYDPTFPFDEKGVHVLHRLVRCSDLTLIERALKSGANANGVNRAEETLLHQVGHFSWSDEFDFDPLDLMAVLA